MDVPMRNMQFSENLNIPEMPQSLATTQGRSCATASTGSHSVDKCFYKDFEPRPSFSFSMSDAMFHEPSFLRAPEAPKDLWQPFHGARLYLTATLVILAISVSTILRPENFATWLRIENAPTLRNCIHYCNRAEELWFPGLCEPSETGNATLRFKHCHRRAPGAFRDCTGVYDLDAVPLNDAIHGHSRVCEFKVVRPIWMPLTTLVIFTLCIALVIQGLPAEVVLLGGAAMLSLIGILPRSDVFAGLSNSGVISLGVLFPIAAAIEETGLLEKVVGVVLGAPKSLNAALLRMMFVVAFLSAFLSNTATVALMIPMLVTWARRLDVHPGKMLMPLSFAAQLGGSMTVLGSSHCLVAAAVVNRSYKMGFFDLFPLGLLIMIGITLIIIPVAGSSLLSSSASAPSPDENDGCVEGVYKLQCVVNHYGGIAGKTVEDSGLGRMEGLHQVRLAERWRALEVEEDGEHVLESGDTLWVWADPKGIMSLRRLAGVDLVEQPKLNLFGGSRRYRALYEVTVAAKSEFITTDVLSEDRVMLKDFAAVFIGGPKCFPGTEPGAVQPGDVLIFEMDDDWSGADARARWMAACSQMTKLPGSSPPYSDSMVDKIRSFIVGFGMIALIGAASIPSLNVKLEIGGTIFILVLLMVGALTVRKLFSSIRHDILFIIAGALAMGEALQQTGVVNYIADNLLRVAAPGGPVGIIIAVYALSVFLSMFINNSATIAILGPLILSVCDQNPNNDVKVLTWTMVYAAGSCFTTPLGYQTNLMVMPAGEYSFGDFLKFGAVIQLAHMGLTVLLLYFFGSYLPPFPLVTAPGS